MPVPSLFMSDVVDNYLAKVQHLDKRHRDEFGEHAGPVLTGLSHEERTTLAREIRSSRIAEEVESALSRARFTTEEIQ